MKRIFLLFIILFSSIKFVLSQKVDSIKVEQTGDFIKIHYKILDSNPNQVFRVSALCSIDGGLKSQMNSLVGDFGENIIGGRSDYMIIWDVLKDINELKSAEFFIKAELVKDLSKYPGNADEATKFWQKQYFNIQFVTDLPGQKFGLRIGYLRSFGISAQLFYGKTPLADEYKNFSVYDSRAWYSVGLDLTRRVINSNKFQMHLIGGYRNSDLHVYFAGPPSPQIWRQGMHGLESGTVIVFNKLVTTFMFSHLDPKQLEKNDDKVVIASPYNFFNFGIGFRF